MTHGDRHALDHGLPGDPADRGPLLDRREAAEFLGVSTSTVYRLLRRGDLRAYRVGHSIRLTQIDIENYLRQLPPPSIEED
jgi:excisionase family DNA binding protein